MNKRKESLEAELLGRGQAIIVEELSKIPLFRQRLHKMAKQFQDMVEIEEIDYPADIRLPRQMRNKLNVEVRVREYINKLREIADLYNLRCDWVINGLHQMIRNIIDPSIKTPIENWYTRYRIDKLCIPIHADTRKEEIAHLIDEEWKKLKSKHAELQRRIAGQHNQEFKRNVHWLCRRLFKGENAISIGIRENYQSDTVRLKIKETAKLLGIELPRGRPRSIKRYD